MSNWDDTLGQKRMESASSGETEGAALEVKSSQTATDEGRNAAETSKWSSPLAVSEEGDTAVQSGLANPWARLLARWFDIYLITWVFSFTVGWASSVYAPSFYIKFFGQHEAILSIELLPIVGIILAFMMALTGTTVGKAILGIRIRNRNGGNSLLFYLRRELKVWVLGLSFGIPLANLAAMISQRQNLIKTGATSYDRGSVSVTGKSSPVRYGLAGLFLAGTIVTSAFLSDNVEEAEADVGRVQTWVNPITKKNATISKTWHFEEMEAETGKLYYFNSDQLLSEIIFGYEPMDEDYIDPVAYGEALQEAISDDLLVKSEWKPLDIDGLDAARASAVHKSSADTNVDITVAIVGRSAWRILVFTRGRPFEKLPASKSLLKQLLSTTRDINVPTNMPCEDESCVSALDVPRLAY